MPSRRELLSSGTALLTAAALAGCNTDAGFLGTPTDTPTETSLPSPNLRREPLYLGPDFDLEFPAGVTLVDDPAQATVALLAPDTTVSPDEVVSWLEAGFPVAVVGVPAVETMGRLLEAGDADPPGDLSYMGAGGDDPAVVFCIVPKRDDWDTVAGFTGDPNGRDRSERLRDVEYVVRAVVQRGE